MGLIKRKCEDCGRNLRFNKTRKEMVCDYCIEHPHHAGYNRLIKTGVIIKNKS